MKEWRLVQLRQALENLASEPEQQVAALFRDGFQVSVDELGLDLGDSIERLEGSHALSTEQDAALRQLLDLIHEFSGHENADLWTPEALKTAPQWQRARDLARKALSMLPPSGHDRAG